MLIPFMVVKVRRQTIVSTLAGSGKSLTVSRESFYVAASRAKHEFKVYTASKKALGLSVGRSRAQENAIPLIVKQPLFQQSSIPTREEKIPTTYCS